MTTDEKGVFIQIQNTIVSSKALVLVNCLSIFVHDCSEWVVHRYCTTSSGRNNNYSANGVFLENVLA